MTVINVSYIVYISFILLINYEFIKLNYIKDLSKYLSIYSFIIIYFILIFMSYLIANRYSRKLFKKSAMNTYREEV